MTLLALPIKPREIMILDVKGSRLIRIYWYKSPFDTAFGSH